MTQMKAVERSLKVLGTAARKLNDEEVIGSMNVHCEATILWILQAIEYAEESLQSYSDAIMPMGE